MSYHANDRDPSNCPICQAELHSVNTKRIGNKVVCRECAYKLMELWNAIGDQLVHEVMPLARTTDWNLSAELIIDDLADKHGVVI